MIPILVRRGAGRRGGGEAERRGGAKIGSGGEGEGRRGRGEGDGLPMSGKKRAHLGEGV